MTQGATDTPESRAQALQKLIVILARQLVGSHQMIHGNVTVDKETFLALAEALRATGASP